MSDITIYRQIVNTLERLRIDYVESKYFNLVFAIISLIAGIMLLVYLFCWANLSKYKDIVGPLTTAAGGMISFAIAFQLKEFVKDRRKLNHIIGMQIDVKAYPTSESSDDKKFFEGQFLRILESCFK